MGFEEGGTIMNKTTIDAIRAGFGEGLVIPYLGPGVLALAGPDCPLPAAPGQLVGRLTAKATVPHKIRGNLTAAAQFIENFKHRKTVVAAMNEAFHAALEPTELHCRLAAFPSLPLLVHAWYDDLPQKALARRSNWGIVQGVSQSEHFGDWVHYFRGDGVPVQGIPVDGHDGEGPVPKRPPEEAGDWATLLYQPLGSVRPAGNYLVSDSDYVEVLTEIDIQTPIPEVVRNLRAGRNFLFLGCRFNTQLERIFARQIIKRSSDRHWAVLPGELSRNERRFFEDYHIERIDMPLPDFVAALRREEVKAKADAA